jgi:hypothetical protein
MARPTAPQRAWPAITNALEVGICRPEAVFARWNNLQEAPRPTTNSICLSQATHKLNGVSDFRIGDLRKIRFYLREHCVEVRKLYRSRLRRLLRQSPCAIQYSGAPQFQHLYDESAVGIAELDQGVLPREPPQLNDHTLVRRSGIERRRSFSNFDFNQLFTPPAGAGNGTEISLGGIIALVDRVA